MPLDKDTKYTIHGVNGGTNELVIADGQVWLEQASCPDKLCVHQGKIQYAGQSIICLPNQVTLQLYSRDELMDWLTTVQEDAANE